MLTCQALVTEPAIGLLSRSAAIIPDLQTMMQQRRRGAADDSDDRSNSADTLDNEKNGYGRLSLLPIVGAIAAGILFTTLVLNLLSNRSQLQHGAMPVQLSISAATWCSRAQAIQICSHRGFIDVETSPAGHLERLGLLLQHGVTCSDLDVLETRDGVLIAAYPGDIQAALKKMGQTNTNAENHTSESLETLGLTDAFPRVETILKNLSKALAATKPQSAQSGHEARSLQHMSQSSAGVSPTSTLQAAKEAAGQWAVLHRQPGKFPMGQTHAGRAMMRIGVKSGSADTGDHDAAANQEADVGSTGRGQAAASAHSSLSTAPQHSPILFIELKGKAFNLKSLQWLSQQITANGLSGMVHVWFTDVRHAETDKLMHAIHEHGLSVRTVRGYLDSLPGPDGRRVPRKAGFMAQDASFDMFGPSIGLGSDEVYRKAKETGKKLAVWTVDTLPLLERSIGYSADIVITNKPLALQQLVKEQLKHRGC